LLTMYLINIFKQFFSNKTDKARYKKKSMRYTLKTECYINHRFNADKVQ